MKKLMRILLAFSFTSSLVLTTALGQPFPNQTWTFDEQGHGLFTGPIVGFSNGFLSVEPISQMLALTYNLGYAGTPGDLLLIEPVPPGTTISDLIRFDGQGHVFFFSDLEPGEVGGDLADVPQLPQPVGAFVPNLIENGPEGNNGALWNPLPGEAGSDPVVPGIHYNFISDIPEPGSAVLVLCGAGVFGLSRARRGRRSQAAQAGKPRAWGNGYGSLPRQTSEHSPRLKP